ncbi:MAG: hypothetical protein ABEJ65_08120 [bacterium]
MSDTTDEIDRHREHPRDRFAGAERLQNLDEVTKKMLNEELDDVHVKQGHRQYTLVREGPLTITLFHFEEGGELTEHQVDGITTLQILEGQVGLETDLSQQVLAEDDFFVLEPGLAHSITAYAESLFVLTIAREQG